MLYAVVRDHLDAFLREAAARGGGDSLPQFVELEFREFLTCGVLAHGFARFRCAGCTFEHLVPFSCKGRGFCPSCGGRPRLIATVEDPAVVARILAHLGQPRSPETMGPAPPQAALSAAASGQ